MKFETKEMYKYPPKLNKNKFIVGCTTIGKRFSVKTLFTYDLYEFFF